MKGWVRRSTGSWYDVEDTETGVHYKCRVRGKLRLKGIRTTNPIAAGDYVSFEKDESKEGLGIISSVFPRKNYIIRKSVKLSHESHILAANVDQLLLLVTIKDPQTLTGFIDRVLVTAEAYDIPARLVFTKTDIYSKEEFEKVKVLGRVYENIGYPVSYVSIHHKEDIETLKNLMRDKVSMLSGHSGVGKSSILKGMDPELDISIGEISASYRSGQHTTTFAELFTLEGNIHVIDTPGIRAFGVIDFDVRFLSHYFPEMAQRIHQCKFTDCLHINEPKCAVKEAVENGEISEKRYENYLSIFDEEKTQDYR